MQNYNQNQFVPGYNDASSLHIRIDTDALKQKIRLHLMGVGEVLELQDGKLKKVFKQTGKAKANTEGIQGIMLFVEQIINAHTVQGNTDPEGFGRVMYYLRGDLSRYIWVNLYKYDVDETEYDGIIDSICLMAKLFISRTVNNEERRSYGESWQIREGTPNNQLARRKSLMSWIPFIGG